MKLWNKAGQAIDSANEWMGRVGWALVVLMMSFGLYDVIMRYLFNRPSQWIYLTLQMAMVVLIALAGGYAFPSFVKMDVLYSRFSRRGKAIADICTFAFIGLSCVILIWKGIGTAQYSIGVQEVTPTSVRMPVYYIKPLIPLGALLVFSVAVRKLISDIRTVFHKGAGAESGEPTGFTQVRF